MMIFKHLLKYSLLGAVLFMFGGCWLCPCPPPVEKPPVIIYKYKKVPVVVGCRIPEVKCDFKGSGLEPTQKMLECIILQKKAIEACDAEADDIDQQGVNKLKSLQLNEE